MVVSSFGYNLWAVLGIYFPSALTHWCDITGTQRCGVPTRMNGIPNDGSRELGIPKYQLEHTGTCVLCLFELWITADALAELPSPEVSGLASDGDLRLSSCLFLDVPRFDPILQGP